MDISEAITSGTIYRDMHGAEIIPTKKHPHKMQVLIDYIQEITPRRREAVKGVKCAMLFDRRGDRRERRGYSPVYHRVYIAVCNIVYQ